LNKTVVVELDQNGKEIFHTAGYEKYWISRVGMETVWLRKERVKEVVSVQETFAAMEFLEKPERGIVSAEISIRMKMIDESCRWTRVGYEIMMPDNGTDKKVVVTFTDEEKEKQSEAEYAEVIRERDNLILTISGGIAIYRQNTDCLYYGRNGGACRLYEKGIDGDYRGKCVGIMPSR
jgi:hypothetical protein